MEIVNKVAGSGLVTLDLENFYPKGERILIDIQEQLFQGLILREKDFRAYISNTDWSTYKDKFVAITCSTDAIVPTWAFMLVAGALEPFAKRVVFGNLERLEELLFQEQLSKLNIQEFAGAKVVVKGCGDIAVPKAAYVELMLLLRPVAKSIMYGEPCSTVPLYKQTK